MVQITGRSICDLIRVILSTVCLVIIKNKDILTVTVETSLSCKNRLIRLQISKQMTRTGLPGSCCIISHVSLATRLHQRSPLVEDYPAFYWMLITSWCIYDCFWPIVLLTRLHERLWVCVCAWLNPYISYWLSKQKETQRRKKHHPQTWLTESSGGLCILTHSTDGPFTCRNLWKRFVKPSKSFLETWKTQELCLNLYSAST